MNSVPTELKEHMGLREWLMILVLSVLWGGSFFFIEIAVTSLPVFTIVSLRVALAAMALWIFVFVKGLSVPRSLHIWLSFLGMGLLNIIQTPFLYLGAIGVMLAVDWRLALWVILPYPLFVGIARLFGRIPLRKTT